MGIRTKLALSYAAIVIVAGTILLAVVWLFLLRYVPDTQIPLRGPFVPGRSDLERAFWPRAGWAFAFLVAFGLAGGWFLAGRMLAPLNEITRATRAATEGSLSHRIRMTGRGDEFGELADAFDGMLERIEAHVDEQRRFAANASHELRTPLAITRSMLDVARTDPGADVAATLARLSATNDRAIALTEALLALAATDRADAPQMRVDLSLAAEHAVETLVGLAEDGGIAVDVAGEAAYTSGSEALLWQLAVNLLHNGIVHNSPGGWVRVETSTQSDQAVLTIENTGEWIPDEVIPTLVEPFQRQAGRTRVDGREGSGLGLAVAQRIVEAHGGTLVLAARAAGGLRAEVRLLAAPPDAG
ncbi:two-component sensor histidine kinase [Pseudoclavibacter endophyticus]|uniref:histidine kinase n=1 Tax=Pseudoclavibacter endophyticus TaxID=1778590 RepID=A0A6H9WTI2_9MICO|nr:HAMP domain-containing sensor histidine kinase [Pseudoclavibacter endophyticus]KAB1649714.1 HAMP domain-containing histidine kinase [Pseudoclavibacter endophyticus]GGA60334.1 two-component sensor histidine kinase [Pseudoclavibacter endophyticus]